MTTINSIGSDNPIEVGKGGSGASSLTDHGVLVGSGTSAFTALSVMTNGQVLIGSTGADPSPASITSSDSSITLTAGAGTLSIVVDPSNVDHDSLLNFSANEHIDWTSTSSNFSTSGTLAAGISTLTSINLTANSNQIVLDSDDGSGFTTTITDSATAARTLTLPDATDTLVGKATTDILTNKTFDANGTGNSLSNVDVSDLSNGTDGELITWDSSGNPTTVGVGSAGQVLTSNGAGAAPTFVGPDWELISSASASNSSAVDFTGLNSSYSAYRLYISELITATDSVQILLRTSTDNGVSYDSGASDYAYAGRYQVDNATGANIGSAGTTEIPITGGNLGNATNEDFSSIIDIFRPSGTNYTRVIATSCLTLASAGNHAWTSVAGARLSAADVDAIRILASSGNITSGEFRLYGQKNS